MPRRLTWTAYLFMAAQGYLLYAVGFITPYLGRDLGVPPWVSALPSSMMAIGIIAAGEPVRRIVARIGGRSAVRLWAVTMAVAAGLMSLTGSIVTVLAGAFVLGVAIAGLLVHVVSALGGREGGRLLTRAYLWAMMAASASSLVLSFAARSSGWATALLVPVPALVLLAVILPASPAGDRPSLAARESALPAAFWLGWGFIVLSMAAEFTIVNWGAGVAAERAALAMPDATALAGLFGAGMVAGRVVWSMLPARRGLLLLQASALAAIAGCALLLLSAVEWLTGTAFILAGVGLSAAAPVGSALAVASAADAPVRASARVSGAMGVSLLATPVLAGAIAGAAGMSAALILVLVLLAASFAMVVRLGRASTGRVAS